MKLYILFMLMLFSSCEKSLDRDYHSGDFFYLEHKKAIMPVWVKGNTDSKIFCIFLHGGPGLSSLTYANNQAYENLQKDYAFVFWDQRASGASQGNAQPETINLNQFIEDTDRLIDLIREKYGLEKVFLVGKSWGGGLGTGYLLSSNHQEKIKGWIEIAGTHNWRRALKLSVRYMTNYADDQVNQNIQRDYWQDASTFYKNDGTDRDFHFWKNHGKYLNAANAIYKDPANDPGNAKEWNSPLPLLSILNGVYVSKHLLDEMSNLDLSKDMYKIRVPSLILWGEHDHNIPVELAYEAFDSIGTNINDKYLHVFSNSAHSPSFEEPDLFIERVQLFIENYK